MIVSVCVCACVADDDIYFHFIHFCPYKHVIRFDFTLNKTFVCSFFSILFAFRFHFMQIMALLAPIIGAEKTKEFFLQKYLELCVNEHYDVRKMCAVYCPHLCKVLGQQSSEEYLVNIMFSCPMAHR